MTELTVQVPVSQLKRWRDDLAALLPPGTYAIRQELDALLSQPTPTAEPPRIEDMAPGTTLWARFRDEHHDRFLVIVNEPEWPVLDPMAADQYQYGRVDPSTIRDVTPPKE